MLDDGTAILKYTGTCTHPHTHMHILCDSRKFVTAMYIVEEHI
jgi:hypothetical protein